MSGGASSSRVVRRGELHSHPPERTAAGREGRGGVEWGRGERTQLEPHPRDWATASRTALRERGMGARLRPPTTGGRLGDVFQMMSLEGPARLQSILSSGLDDGGLGGIPGGDTRCGEEAVRRHRKRSRVCQILPVQDRSSCRELTAMSTRYCETTSASHLRAKWLARRSTGEPRVPKPGRRGSGRAGPSASSSGSAMAIAPTLCCRSCSMP